MDHRQHPPPAVPTWRLFNRKHTHNKPNHSPHSSPNQMSSTTATATATATTLRQTYWCHECDMSISLLFSSSSSVPLQVVCPHSHSHLLELMDSHSHYPCPPQPHFLDFNLDEDDDDDDDPPPPPPTSLVSSLTTIQISDSISQESCAICKDEFCGQSEVQQLPCKHLYHSHCILPWLYLHSSCPLCRFQLPVSGLLAGDIS